MMPRTVPIAYIPNESKIKTLQKIIFEEHRSFEILWYCWPEDGFFPVEDYEPVILVYNMEDEICCVCLRRGWMYKPATIDDLEFPLEVGFEGGFHHPFLHYKNDNGDFVKRFSDYAKAKLSPSPDGVGKIPALARTGRGHPTLLKRAGIPVMDPAKKAFQLQSEYCSDI